MSLNPTNISYAPAGTDGTVAADTSVVSGQPIQHVFDASDFGFSDPQASYYVNRGYVYDNFYSVVITTVGVTVGSLTYDGAAVHAGDEIMVADLGKLVYTAPSGQATAGIASFTFQVTDDGYGIGDFMDQSPNTMTIDVGAVNSAPTGTSQTVSMLEEGVYTFSASDFGFSDAADAGAANNFKSIIIDSGDLYGTLTLNGVEVAAQQEIAVSDLGNLVFTPDKDASGSGMLHLNFYVVDDGGTARHGHDTSAKTATLTIDIEGVNDAPSGADKTITYAEDSGKHVLSSDLFGFSDALDAVDGATPNNLSKVIIDSVSGQGVFMLGDTAIHDGQVIDVADLPSLTFQSAKNGSGNGYASLSFRLVDDGGTAHGGSDTETTAHTLTFDITPVNDAPSGTSQTVTYAEDKKQTLGSAIFGFTDSSDAPDSNALSKVIIDAVSGKGNFLVGGTAIHNGQEISADELASLTFQSAKNGFGNNYASLTFRVVDDGGTSGGGQNTEATAHMLKFNVTDVVDKFTGTAAKNVLKGTAGHDILDGKGGDDKLTGFAGADTFVFGNGCGKDLVTDFDTKGADHDSIDLSKLSGFDSLDDVKHNAHRDGLDLVISGNHGEEITLAHVKLASLSAADFQF